VQKEELELKKEMFVVRLCHQWMLFTMQNATQISKKTLKSEIYSENLHNTSLFNSPNQKNKPRYEKAYAPTAKQAL